MVLALHYPSFTTKLTPAHYLKEIIRVKKISSTSNHLVETFTTTVSNDHYETLPPTPPPQIHPSRKKLFDFCFSEKNFSPHDGIKFYELELFRRRRNVAPCGVEVPRSGSAQELAQIQSGKSY
jgi:hypothetical protein